MAAETLPPSMVFSSTIFLVWFLPFFLLLYYLADPRYRNILVLLAGTFFFAWGAPVFILVLWVSVLFDYYWNAWIAMTLGRKRKFLFMLALLFNIGMLIYYKYVNFFIDNVNEISGVLGLAPVNWTGIALPLGISFIVFQKVSYSIDVYRNHQPPSASLAAYACYILMFPKLLAGPIVRYREMADGLEKGLGQIGYEDRLTGFFRFTVGLAKKVLIANVLGETVDQLFALPAGDLGAGLAWLGALGYTFQIYFDFSGYSDMAIGLAMMLGFRFGENFNNPYIAGSITEFWRRWHITLSNWLRDYLFLPLAYASSRRLKRDRYYGMRTDHWLYAWATAVTMVICGFWHGAAWTFILWGLYQGVIMILERLFLLRLYRKGTRYLAVFLTFLFTVTGWVFFRSASVPEGAVYLQQMWTAGQGGADLVLSGKFITMLVLAAVFSFTALVPGVEQWQMRMFSPGRKTAGLAWMTLAALLLFVFSLSAITASGFSPFIYFRF